MVGVEKMAAGFPVVMVYINVGRRTVFSILLCIGFRTLGMCGSGAGREMYINPLAALLRLFLSVHQSQ
jgi:hypothetical protein